ncbi:MAG TPA: hypothetical protein VH724_13435, partial [Candidatus Angelobacter sp.]|nr:hypothetical protein [Candidatus Angelobacter sp.]
ANGKMVTPPHFGSRLIASIPHGRKGKHNQIVSMILDDLDNLAPESAVLVPIESLEAEKMANVRSALNRATRQRKMLVATATDDKYFYVWRTKQQDPQTAAVPNRLTQRISSARN